jgi:protein O-mannosyl-transferase
MRWPATQAKPTPPKAATPVRGRPGLPAWLLAVWLVLGTMALYWSATRCDFVNLDDSLHVTANVQVQKGLTLDSLKWAWLNPVNCIWHPVTVWSHMLDCQLFGLNPWGHHLSSVLLHAVNTGLVFLMLRGLTGARWRSVLVAALFGWHPLHVESVAWVAERKDVLSSFFGLLALMAYARYAQVQSLKSKVQSLKPEAGTEDAESGMQKPAIPNTQHATRLASHACTFYLLSLFCFALGLMSKPMLVTWPCVMLLLDYWPLRRNAECRIRNAESDAGAAGQWRTLPWTKLVWEKAPFFVLAVAASVVTFVVQQRAGALAAVENLPLGARSGNALISYGRYLGKLFWPTELAVFYPHPRQWPLGQVLLAGVLLLGLSVLVWLVRRRYPYLLVGWLWFCGTLAPVSQVVQTGGHAMADRYTYLPSLGMLILTVWGVRELTRRWRYCALAVSVAGGATLVVCLELTRQQIGFWKDSETLFRHALDVTENNHLAHCALANALLEKGQIDDALRQLHEALRLRPGFAGAHNLLGVTLAKKGQIDEAVSQIQEALRLKPDCAEAYYNLGTALNEKGQNDEAIRQFQAAIRLKPDYAEAHYNLGAALDRKGQTDEAIRQYQEALRAKPNYADVHNNLGIALGKKSQVDEAIRQFQEAIRLKPDHADARYNLGLLLGNKGQMDEAIRQFQEALRLKPDFVGARKYLDAALIIKARSSAPPDAPTNR